MKNRIMTLARVSSTEKMNIDQWMSTRKKAVVDMPQARAHHVAVNFGSGLFVHGGQSGEGNKTLSDWCLFDWGLMIWMNCSVDEVMPDESLQKFEHARKYHTLTPVIEPNLTNGRELTR